jgi:hypothetical protein
VLTFKASQILKLALNQHTAGSTANGGGTSVALVASDSDAALAKD